MGGGIVIGPAKASSASLGLKPITAQEYDIKSYSDRVYEILAVDRKQSGTEGSITLKNRIYTSMLFPFIIIISGSCNDKGDSPNSGAAVDRSSEVTSNFRKSWSDKNLLILDNGSSTTGYCLRLTGLPGGCEIVRLEQDLQNPSVPLIKGPYKNTCDVSAEKQPDTSWHIEVNCTNKDNTHCFDRSGTGINFEVEALNSEDEFEGNETLLKGTGNWKIGPDLCKDYFASATK